MQKAHREMNKVSKNSTILDKTVDLHKAGRIHLWEAWWESDNSWYNYLEMEKNIYKIYKYTGHLPFTI